MVKHTMSRPVEAAPKAFGAANLQSVGAACSHGPVRLSLRAGSVGRRLNKKCLQNSSQSRGYSTAFTLPEQRGPESVRGFTLAELLVSVFVLVLLVFLFTQLLNSAATITTLGNKRMDADSEARQVFDRMALDFAQMVKRSDLDYFAKNTVAPNSVGGFMSGNDKVAFYSSAPGYYPSTGSQSPVSLVAYRVNAQNQLERMGVGLVWNAVSSTDIPVVFMPITISATWPSATDLTASPTPEPRAEVIGPDVFRFEYYYLVRTGTSPFLTYYPCTGIGCVGTDWGSVMAIVVDIALIDPKSKVLLSGNLPAVASLLVDFGGDDNSPGHLINKWQNKLNGITTFPRPAVSGIRVYERYFYLTQ